MNDSVLIWETYTSLHEANLISKDPLHLELEKLLKEKNVQKPEIVNWFLKTYIKWFQSPTDDNQKTQFVSNYQAKETDPDWAKREGIVQFKSFTPEYKDRLLHVVDFLVTKDEFYLKSLFKVTVPQMFEEVQKWDQEMERSSEKAKKAKLQSVQGTDYEVVGVYDGYPVWKLTSNKAFREESMYMGHCVGQAYGENRVTSVEGRESEYFRNYKQGELLIFSLRDPKEHNHPAVTFELRKVYGEKTFQIFQIKGPANREVSERYRKSCREFIEDKEFVVKKDGANIGMFLLKNKFYFEKTPEFEKIYQEELIPRQNLVIKNIKSRIDNGVIKGGVDLHDLFLTELPDLSMCKIDGPFNCSGNRLTSLKGAPYEVTDFYCSVNQLTSLEGAPKKVSHFYCNDNKLTSLKGAPEYVKDSFHCTNNKLTTLEGSPKKLSHSFYCDNNQLTSLKGAPKKVSHFNCNDNKLITLEGAPEFVDTFYCNNNQLISLKGAPEYVSSTFDCSFNKLTKLDGVPEVEDYVYVIHHDNPVNFTDEDILRAVRETRKRNEQKETKLESFKQFFTEACWKNYKQVGMKKKGKKKVPNCVPK